MTPFSLAETTSPVFRTVYIYVLTNLLPLQLLPRLFLIFPLRTKQNRDGSIVLVCIRNITTLYAANHLSSFHPIDLKMKMSAYFLRNQRAMKKIIPCRCCSPRQGAARCTSWRLSWSMGSRSWRHWYACLGPNSIGKSCLDFSLN